MPKTKSFLIVFITVIILTSLACAPKSRDLYKATNISEEIYNEMTPQVDLALKNSKQNSDRYNTLLKVREKLSQYKQSHEKCMEVITEWDKTGEIPDNARSNYNDMKDSISEAVILAQTVYIYPSECTSRTGLKGKASNNCF